METLDGFKAADMEQLARFLDYVQGHEHVWVARRSEIAEHWRSIFPYAPGAEQIARVGP